MSQMESDQEDHGYDVAIVDADSLVYRSCFGAGDGPVEHALHNAKLAIEGILDITNCETYTIYLSGKGNFRFDIATIKPYKGNRVQPKPPWYEETRAYIANNWGAIFVDGQEADDACSIDHVRSQADGFNPVLVSIDKDLNMVPGWHLNPVKNLFYYVNEVDGLRSFYKQMLVGDSSDNIQGIDGLGPIKSERLLKDLTDRVGMETCVQNEYQRQYGDKWLEAMTEVGRLLWMRRTEGEMWEPIVK